MANPLQPKVIATLEDRYGAYVVKVTQASKAGHMDVLACVKGRFYGFEVKWRSDQPSELQKDKINRLIDAGGRGYFIRSVAQLCSILDGDLEPVRYEVSTRITL